MVGREGRGRTKDQRELSSRGLSFFLPSHGHLPPLRRNEKKSTTGRSMSNITPRQNTFKFVSHNSDEREREKEPKTGRRSSS